MLEGIILGGAFLSIVILMYYNGYNNGYRDGRLEYLESKEVN
jgi:hypothetical protein